MTIIIEAELTDSHEIVLKLPTLKPGRFRIAVDPIGTSDIKGKLQASGLLAESHFADAIPVSDEEVEQLGRLFAAEKTIAEQVIQDRDDRL